MLLRNTRLFVAGVLLIVSLQFVQAANAAAVAGGDLRTTYDWKQVKIGGGGFVTGIVSHPSVAGLFYCRADVGGAYRLLPGHDTWEQIVTASSVPPSFVAYADYQGVDGIGVSASDPDVVYIAYKGNVLRSSDRGGHFVAGNLAVTMNANDEGRYAERLGADPLNANVVYLGTRKDGLWRTLDGLTWTKVMPVPAGVYASNGICGIVRVLVDPGAGNVSGRSRTVYAFVYGTSGGGGVYCSYDGGATWSDISVLPDGPGKAALFRDADVSPAGGFVCISPNRAWRWNGTAWRAIAVPGSGDLMDVAVDPANDARIICTSSNGGQFRTTDGGSHWIGPLPALRRSPQIPWMASTDESLVFHRRGDLRLTRARSDLDGRGDRRVVERRSGHA